MHMMVYAYWAPWMHGQAVLLSEVMGSDSSTIEPAQL